MKEVRREGYQGSRFYVRRIKVLCNRLAVHSLLSFTYHYAAQRATP